MTKAQMIESIREREAYAWYKLIAQECREAPSTDDVEETIKWCSNDKTHIALLSAWAKLDRLLESYNIEPDYGNYYRTLAYDLQKARCANT